MERPGRVDPRREGDDDEGVREDEGNMDWQRHRGPQQDGQQQDGRHEASGLGVAHLALAAVEPHGGVGGAGGRGAARGPGGGRAAEADGGGKAGHVFPKKY